MIDFFKNLFKKSEDQKKAMDLQVEINSLKRIVQDLEIENSDLEIAKFNLMDENQELQRHIDKLNRKIDSIKIVLEYK